MTREDLEKYKDNEKWVKELEEEYANKLESIKRLGQVITDMPKAQNKPNYAHEELMDAYKEMLNVAYKKQQQLNMIVKQLDELDKPLYSRILFLLYIKGLPLEDVSDKVGYSYNKVSTYKGWALNEFDKLDSTRKE